MHTQARGDACTFRFIDLGIRLHTYIHMHTQARGDACTFRLIDLALNLMLALILTPTHHPSPSPSHLLAER